MALEMLNAVPEFKLKKLEGAKKLFKIEKVERVKAPEPEPTLTSAQPSDIP